MPAVYACTDTVCGPGTARYVPDQLPLSSASIVRVTRVPPVQAGSVPPPQSASASEARGRALPCTVNKPGITCWPDVGVEMPVACTDTV